jgi:hypothetical protein
VPLGIRNAATDGVIAHSGKTVPFRHISSLSNKNSVQKYKNIYSKAFDVLCCICVIGNKDYSTRQKCIKFVCLVV